MSLFHPTLAFILAIDTLLMLEKAQQPDGKRGGPQDLLRLIVGRLTPAGEITLEEAELLKIKRYAWKYGGGTYERAFRGIIRDARAAGWDEPKGEDAHASRPAHRGRRWDGLTS